MHDQQMELLATGFNAWNQLSFEASPGGTGERKVDDYTEDVQAFRRILSGDGPVEHIYSSISCTLVKTGRELLSAGHPDEWMQLPVLRNKIIAGTAAVAGNGGIAVFVDGACCIHQYQNLDDFQEGIKQACFRGLGTIVQIVSYETGFAALSDSGKVWTWGDERYSACLGRHVTEQSPAEAPGRVDELEDLPTGSIRKLAAGGYLLMALTEGNDLYAWGGHPGRPALIEGLSRGPLPVVVDDHDVADCAAGQSHAVLLTVEGTLFAVGDNGTGQLGLSTAKVNSWTQVPFHPSPGSSAIAVACGPLNSFVLLRNDIAAL